MLRLPDAVVERIADGIPEAGLAPHREALPHFCSTGHSVFRSEQIAPDCPLAEAAGAQVRAVLALLKHALVWGLVRPAVGD